MILDNGSLHEAPPCGLRRAKRIAGWGGVVIVAIAYAVLIPMKWHGVLPPHMTWTKVALGPALAAALTPLIVFSDGKTGMLRWLLIWILLLVVVMLFDTTLIGASR